MHVLARLGGIEARDSMLGYVQQALSGEAEMLVCVLDLGRRFPSARFAPRGPMRPTKVVLCGWQVCRYSHVSNRMASQPWAGNSEYIQITHLGLVQASQPRYLRASGAHECGWQGRSTHPTRSASGELICSLAPSKSYVVAPLVCVCPTSGACALFRIHACTHCLSKVISGKRGARISFCTRWSLVDKGREVNASSHGPLRSIS